MTMHVVLGDGEMTKTELNKTLQDLWEQAGDDSFWFVIQGKSAPTETDTNFVNWLMKNELYFEVITDDADAMDEVYAEAQETHVVKRLGQKVVNLLNTKPEENEDADVLALFVSDDPAAEEDRWLNNVLEAAAKEGFKIKAFNDGLTELDLDAADDDAEPEPEEEEEVPTKPTKRAAKKAPAAAPAKAKTYTRDELEEMELDQLKVIAAEKGIELPLRTRHATYINEILGDKDAPAVEISTPPVTKTVQSSNGDEDNTGIDGLVDEVTEAVFKRLVQALQA